MTQERTSSRAAADSASTGELVARLSEQVSTLVKDELALARAELTEKGKRAGKGAGLLGGGTVLALYGVGLLLVTIVLALDSTLSRIDAAILIALFGSWLVLTTRAARRERSAAVAVLAERSHVRSLIEMVAGLAFLVAAGRLIVFGAKGVGAEVGLDTFVIGATIVAIGTSTPELATTLVARVRGHSEVGLGTVVGSNIYNGGFVIAIAALIHPIEFGFRDVGAAIGFGLALVALLLNARGMLTRRLGILFLVIYAGYAALLLTLGPAGHET